MRYVFFLWLLSVVSAQAQILVSGHLLDERGQPVPYASIALTDGRTGTASNEEGEFSLKLPTLPQQLMVLSIGYERAIIAVAQAGPLPAPVVLRASAVRLPEIIVRANAEAEELVRRCYAKLLRHQADVQYGRGFYRQKTREDGHYREVFDAFYDVKITPRTMPSWVLGEARYALTPGVLTMSNFSVYTRLLPLFVVPDAAVRTAIPLGPNAVERFGFVLRQTQRDQGRELAVIDFAPRDPADKVSRGTLYIDVRTAALFRIEKEMPSQGLFNSDNAAIQLTQASLHVITDFSVQNDSLTRVAGTRAVATMRLLVKGVPHESTTTSYFFVYEYGPPTPGQKYRETNQSTVDLAQIKKRRYHPSFWRDNAVIKDSPVEAQIIEDFEGKRVFGKLD